MTAPIRKLLIATANLDIWIAPDWFVERLRKDFPQFQIVRLATNEASGPPIYHLLARSALTLRDLVPVFARLGLRLSTVPVDEWMALARARLARTHDESLAAVVAILSRQDTAAKRPEIAFAATQARLHALQAEVRPVTPNLMERYLAALGIQAVANFPSRPSNGIHKRWHAF